MAKKLSEEEKDKRQSIGYWKKRLKKLLAQEKELTRKTDKNKYRKR